MHKKLKIFSVFGVLFSALIGVFAFSNVSANELPTTMSSSDLTTFNSIYTQFTDYSTKVYTRDSFEIDTFKYASFFENGVPKYDIDYLNVGQITSSSYYKFECPLGCTDYYIFIKNNGSTNLTNLSLSFYCDDALVQLNGEDLYSMALPSNTLIDIVSGGYIGYYFSMNTNLSYFRDTYGIRFNELYNLSYSQMYMGLNCPFSSNTISSGQIGIYVIPISTLELLWDLDTNGYNTGYNTGYSTGYSTGYTEGQSTGYSTGYTEGQSTGYSSGYNVGYSEGQASVDSSNATITSLFGAIVDIPITVLNSLTGATFNNVPIVRILITLFTLFLILYLIKRFIKR